MGSFFFDLVLWLFVRKLPKPREEQQRCGDDVFIPFGFEQDNGNLNDYDQSSKPDEFNDHDF